VEQLLESEFAGEAEVLGVQYLIRNKYNKVNMKYSLQKIVRILLGICMRS
jgi:hypothetical protein